MRPEILFPLFAPSASMKGVGAKLAPVLEKLAGPQVRDVLFLRPSGLIRRPLARAADAIDGATQTFLLTVAAHERPAKFGYPWKIRAFDETGFVHLIWFKGHGPHLERAHPPGAGRAASGKVDRRFTEAQIAHPDYLVPIERADDIPAVETVYPASAGLPSRTVRRLAQGAMERAPELFEWIDAVLLSREGWPAWRSAMEKLHAPLSEADLSPAAAHARRLAYDELLAHQIALARRKRSARRSPAPRITSSALAAGLEASLPFQLTGAQHRALADVRADLAAGHRMTRLIQGDVGSGKTLVAGLAAADVAGAGGQTALMAPTEILARQHCGTLAPLLEAQGLRTVLLTGRDKGRERADKLRRLASGEAALAIGTHALFQDDVAFHDLRLAVIDEQHRFGVAERARLQAKGTAVHLLALSATPIPRTLELTVFGDLDVSRIDEKPPGRTRVATAAVPSDRIGEVVARLRGALADGQQAFWVCPLVAESESSDLSAAEARAEDLRRALGPGVGLVHGRMTSSEKDSVMLDFAERRLSLLVATTVIEVGVDVPNATIMVIEHADRFGLAQLHQLRGRVGRGKRESACVLLYDPPLSDVAQQRLDVLRQTDDGFLIAEKDWELRGGGDPLGLRQSGFPDYRLADPVAHADLIRIAAQDARLLLDRDPDLASPRGQAVQTLLYLFDRAGEADLSAG